MWAWPRVLELAEFKPTHNTQPLFGTKSADLDLDFEVRVRRAGAKKKYKCYYGKEAWWHGQSRGASVAKRLALHLAELCACVVFEVLN